MPDLVPNRLDDAANPLQPGDPFKRNNFNRFALGMCLLIAIFLVLAIGYIMMNRKHQPTPTPPSSSSPQSVLRIDSRTVVS
jgi:hypothetical protein